MRQVEYIGESGQRFEWDEGKSELNAAKHNVRFEEAVTVFDDDLAVVLPDLLHSVGEERFALIGLSAIKSLLTVCHCYRSGDTIRLISARRATRLETDKYYKGANR